MKIKINLILIFIILILFNPLKILAEGNVKYEITELLIENGIVKITGWGINTLDNHKFKENIHSLIFESISDGYKIEINAENTNNCSEKGCGKTFNYDLTCNMFSETGIYNGKECREHSSSEEYVKEANKNSKTENFVYLYSGFYFEIPLNVFELDKTSYKLYLKINSNKKENIQPVVILKEAIKINGKQTVIKDGKVTKFEINTVSSDSFVMNTNPGVYPGTYAFVRKSSGTSKNCLDVRKKLVIEGVTGLPQCSSATEKRVVWKYLNGNPYKILGIIKNPNFKGNDRFDASLITERSITIPNNMYSLGYSTLGLDNNYRNGNRIYIGPGDESLYSRMPSLYAYANWGYVTGPQFVLSGTQLEGEVEGDDGACVNTNYVEKKIYRTVSYAIKNDFGKYTYSILLDEIDATKNPVVSILSNGYFNINDFSEYLKNSERDKKEGENSEKLEITKDFYPNSLEEQNFYYSIKNAYKDPSTNKYKIDITINVKNNENIAQSVLNPALGQFYYVPLKFVLEIKYIDDERCTNEECKDPNLGPLKTYCTESPENEEILHSTIELCDYKGKMLLEKYDSFSDKIKNGLSSMKDEDFQGYSNEPILSNSACMIFEREDLNLKYKSGIEIEAGRGFPYWANLLAEKKLIAIYNHDKIYNDYRYNGGPGYEQNWAGEYNYWLDQKKEVEEHIEILEKMKNEIDNNCFENTCSETKEFIESCDWEFHEFDEDDCDGSSYNLREQNNSYNFEKDFKIIKINDIIDKNKKSKVYNLINYNDLTNLEKMNLNSFSIRFDMYEKSRMKDDSCFERGKDVCDYCGFYTRSGRDYDFCGKDEFDFDLEECPNPRYMCLVIEKPIFTDEICIKGRSFTVSGTYSKYKFDKPIGAPIKEEIKIENAVDLEEDEARDECDDYVYDTENKIRSLKSYLNTINRNIDRLRDDKNDCNNYNDYKRVSSEITYHDSYINKDIKMNKNVDSTNSRKDFKEQKDLVIPQRDGGRIYFNSYWTKTIEKKHNYELPKNNMSLKDPRKTSFEPNSNPVLPSPYKQVDNFIYALLYEDVGRVEDLDFKGEIKGEIISREFDIDCYYNIFIKEIIDENLRVRYRAVDLENLFSTNRIPKNWSSGGYRDRINGVSNMNSAKDYKNYIENKGYNVYTKKVEYSIKLTVQDILNIKKYNDDKDTYLDYSLGQSGTKSSFLQKFNINGNKYYNFHY